MRNLKRLLASLTLAAGFSVLLTAPSAQAAEPVTLDGLTLRPVQIRSAGLTVQQDAYILGPASDESRCLDADLNTIGGNGTKVQLWTCLIAEDNTVPANQAWYITQIPEGYYRLQNAYSGRYLDADLNTIGRNGTVIELWDYMPGGKNQWFNFTQIPEGYLRLQNVYSGRYLDADLNTTGRDGTIVHLWDYVGGAKNQWWF
jgi:hypothetical protein